MRLTIWIYFYIPTINTAFYLTNVRVQSVWKPCKTQVSYLHQEGLPDAHFCSQDCFKLNSTLHKAVHSTATDTGPFNPWPNHKYTGSLRPVYPISPKRFVPEHIQRPDYADDLKGYPYSEMSTRGSTTIQILKPDEIEKMRIVCKKFRGGKKAVKVGVTTDEIDRVIHEACMERDVYPSPLNYYNFPKSVCTSVNEVICHGIPDKYELQDGDIVNLDVTAHKHGFHGDLNDTVLVGNVDSQGRKLVASARKCLDEAIKMVRPGTLIAIWETQSKKLLLKMGFLLFEHTVDTESINFFIALQAFLIMHETRLLEV
ncbi:methionine aminopeptidase 1 [Batrachochytrium salamandrivorans]|nr:methionine aminopeptidase 1 [Batrachochytrium salamandrivorans]